jgi:hypothetical protein
MRSFVKYALGALAFAVCVAGVPIQNTPVTVANLTALRATPTTAAYNGHITRVTDGVAGAPEMQFTSGTAPCGTDDGASCVDSADGKSWVGVFPNGEGDVRQWGADPTGNADSAPAFTAALTAGTKSGIAIVVPIGTYVLNSQVAVTMPTAQSTLSLRGQAGYTTLTWPNASGGIAITGQPNGSMYVIKDLTLHTDQASGGTALAISNATGFTTNPSEISGIVCGGNPELLTNYWTTCMSVQGATNIAIRHITIFGDTTTAGDGIGILFAATSTHPQVIQNVDDVLTDGVQFGMETGDYTQGLAVTKFNCIGGTNCVKDISTVANASNVEIQISNSQFNAHAGDDVELTGAAQNVVLTGGNIMYCAATFSCVKVAPSDNSAGPYTITDNQILPLSVSSKGNGITVTTADASGGYIGANTFSNLPTAITLGASATGWRLGPNTYTSVSTHVSDSSRALWPDLSTLGGNSGSNIGTGTSAFIGIGQGSSTTETHVEYFVPYAIRVYGMNGFAAAPQGSGNSTVCTFKVDGQQATNTITFSNSENPVSADTTHIDTVAANSVIDFLCVPSGSATGTTYTLSVQTNPVQ